MDEEREPNVRCDNEGCGKWFWKAPSQVVITGGNYCSRHCYYEGRKLATPGSSRIERQVEITRSLETVLRSSGLDVRGDKDSHHLIYELKGGSEYLIVVHELR